MSGLSVEGCRARQDRLWAMLPDEAQWLVVADPRHVYYLANALVDPLSFSARERVWLVLLRAGPAWLLADNFTRRSLATTPCVDEEFIETFYDHKHAAGNRDHVMCAAVRRVAPRLARLQGIYEHDWLPASAAATLASIDAGSPERSSRYDLGAMLRTLRRNKHPDELELMRQALAAGAAGHARARTAARAGMTEFELYCQIHQAALQAAGRPVQIYGDFRATSAQAPKRGGPPTHGRLQAGELYLLDFSVVVDGYRSDITNTIAIGPPTAEQQRLFEACLAALQAGEAAIRPAARAADVYRAVASALACSPHAATFTHHAGHGIGLAHPEPPTLVPHSAEMLEAGDVITLEPGLYAAGIGGVRLEHNYLVVEGGCRRLSQHVLTL